MIDRFFGNNRFLSNFWPAEVRYLDLEYPTVEHAYQAAKCSDELIRLQISRLPATNAARAKQMGRVYSDRPDWDEVKLGIMENLVTQKFTNHRLERDALLATRDQELVEGNSWGDQFWGQCNGSGLNHLGKILMKVRKSLSLD